MIDLKSFNHFTLSFYDSDCAIKEESKAAKDAEAAKKLWEVSEKLVGLQK